MAKNDGDQRVLATAQHIVRTLGKNEQLTEDMIRILSTFDDRFSNMTGFKIENHESSISLALKKMEETVGKAEEIIVRWENNVLQNGMMIWDVLSDPQEADAYVKIVDELYSLMRNPWANKELMARAQHVLEIAAPRLKEEFRCMLVMNSESVDADWLMYYTHRGNQEEKRFGIVDSSSDEAFDLTTTGKDLREPALSSIIIYHRHSYIRKTKRSQNCTHFIMKIMSSLSNVKGKHL